MSGLAPELPPPPGESSSAEDDCRLWVGNLDTRITEFAVLKLLQKYGRLKKFDFLYHKSGPDQGKPRGYCFASYPSKEEAEAAIKGLNGKLALSKKLIVRWAHADKSLDPPDSKAKARLQLAPPVQPEVPLSKESKIRQIEEKLRLMESQADDFSVTNQNNESGCTLDKRKTTNADVNHRHYYKHKPYSRTDVRSTHRQSNTRR